MVSELCTDFVFGQDIRQMRTGCNGEYPLSYLTIDERLFVRSCRGLIP